MKRRHGVVISVAWLGAAWCSAQAPNPAPTAAEQLRLLQNNRQLLEKLLNHGLRLSESTTSLQRAEESRAATATVAAAVEEAAQAQSPDRVAELGDHLGTIWNGALIPTLIQARQEISQESPEFRRLQRLEQQAEADIERMERQFRDSAGAPQGIREQLQRMRQEFEVER